MSRRLRKRQAGAVHLNAVERAINAARKLHADDVALLKQAMRTALDEFCQAKRPAAHWNTMADAINLASALADERICSDEGSRAKLAAAEQVLADVARRAVARDCWTLRAAERQALDDGLWLHGVQLEHCSLGEYTRAYERTVNVISQALAGNAAPGTVVIHGAIGHPHAAAANQASAAIQGATP